MPSSAASSSTPSTTVSTPSIPKPAAKLPTPAGLHKAQVAHYHPFSNPVARIMIRSARVHSAYGETPVTAKNATACQDKNFLVEGSGGWTALGMSSGHGPHGGHLSTRVSSELSRCALRHEEKLRLNPITAVEEAFRQ